MVAKRRPSSLKEMKLVFLGARSMSPPTGRSVCTEISCGGRPPRLV